MVLVYQRGPATADNHRSKEPCFYALVGNVGFDETPTLGVEAFFYALVVNVSFAGIPTLGVGNMTMVLVSDEDQQPQSIIYRNNHHSPPSLEM